MQILPDNISARMPPRLELKEHEDKVVLVYGTLTDQKKGAGQYVMLKDVLFHKIIWKDLGKKGISRKTTKASDHIWIDRKVLDECISKNNRTNLVVFSGYIVEYKRKDGTKDYGVEPLPKTQFLIGEIEYHLYILYALANTPNRNVAYPDFVKQEAQIATQLVYNALIDENPIVKLNVTLIGRDKLLGIITLAANLIDSLNKFRANSKKKKKKIKSKKGFGKL